MAARIGPYPISRREDGTASVGPWDFVSDNEWNDYNFSIISSRIPAVNNPALVALTTNINQYTFAVNDYVDLSSIEILHDWAGATITSKL